MQLAESIRRQVIEAENAASAAVVDAHRALQQVADRHHAGGPAVKDAVTQLDLRQEEYNYALRASSRADATEQKSHRADHKQRVEAVLQQARPAQLQALATSPASKTRSGSSSPPTKRLKLGPPSSGPPIQSQQTETKASGGSADSGESESMPPQAPTPARKILYFSDDESESKSQGHYSSSDHEGEDSESVDDC